MTKRLAVCAVAICWMLPAIRAEEHASERAAMLWNAPPSIPNQDLLYGQGGPEHAPQPGNYQFEKEDLEGNNPKFVVRGPDGVKWKVKVGPEAKPETVVTRFVWAVGYTVDEDYFVPALRVEGMPAKLHRGGEFVTADGVIHDARWERDDHKKVGTWDWSKNPFKGSQELNGLRVLMALFNNWDVKEPQNSIYKKGDTNEYLVGDLGSTLGPTGTRWPSATSRGDLEHYGHSDFIKKTTNEYVDFASPSWPMMFGFIPVIPLPYATMSAPLTWFGMRPAVSPMNSRKVGKHVPRSDVVWMAGLLSQLTPAQIRQAFESAAYTPEEAEGFGRVVEGRIQQLVALEH